MELRLALKTLGVPSNNYRELRKAELIALLCEVQEGIGRQTPATAIYESELSLAHDSEYIEATIDDKSR